MLPIVAIVGRPNVGKSTFFNKVAGRKISITENRPGVTRDRVTAQAEWRGKPFTLVDTGGIELKSDDALWRQIAAQAKIAVETADVILFMTDVREGITSSDHDVADFLRRSGKNVVLVVNKLDEYSLDKLFEFYSLGLGEPFGVSSEHSRGIGDVLDKAVELFPRDEVQEDSSLKIAVVGKPNAGKSSLVNKLLGQERSIVTPIAGTTRDAIDTRFTRGEKEYTIIDTAGIRRKRSVEDDVEYYSVLRAFDAVRRADVVLLVVDSEQGLTEQDVKIIGYVHEQGKPSVVVMNKWDLIEKDTHTMKAFEDIHGLFQIGVYLRQNGAARGKNSFRGGRGLRACGIPRTDGRSQRRAFGRGAYFRAAFVFGAQAQTLLCRAGERVSARVCFAGERRNAHALFIRAVFRKCHSQGVRFFGHAR